jgi:hypothetical protein
LEQNIPVWANEYWLAECAVVLLASPSVRDGLIVRAIVVVVRVEVGVHWAIQITAEW